MIITLCLVSGGATAALLPVFSYCGKHVKATTVRVGLTRRGDRIVLTITDDGTGFDATIVAQYVADGHIRLGSLLARFDAMGGAMDTNSRTGRGTQVTVMSPPEPVTLS